MLLAIEIIIGLVFLGVAILLILGMCKCAAMEPPRNDLDAGTLSGSPDYPRRSVRQRT
jgi:hypothetical protein